GLFIMREMKTVPIACLVFLLTIFPGHSPAEEGVVVIDTGRHHLRTGSAPEWAEFPQDSEGSRLRIAFEAERNEREETLLIVQWDVRQLWEVRVNGRKLGRLERDENRMVGSWAVPGGVLREGGNELEIVSSSESTDDIQVGPMHIVRRPVKEVLNGATIDVSVTDADSGQPLPCRLTIVDEQGAMVPIGAKSGGQLAVRTGVVYTGNGRARFGVPDGRYRVFAGRGFEYSRTNKSVNIGRGETRKVKLAIRREVPTSGWVACDTHVHTVTYSGHGDATLDERMITLAAEAVELPIATDHNTHTNYEAAARQSEMRQHFTPVIGNEVTTRRGHFNVFPIASTAKIPDHRVTDWAALLPALFKLSDVQIVILNHGRDVHAGFRPFGPENYNAAVGWNFVGDSILFNAMEVLNSAAQQTDQFELYHDWMSLTNRGYKIAPIGSSDSHDVNRFIVGQGRTYLECDDRDPARIDVTTACRSLREGRVRAGCGLLVDLLVDGQFGPGTTVKVGDEINIEARVLGPSWTTADELKLFANGIEIRREEIGVRNQKRGVIAIRKWKLDRPQHDIFLSALASGPAVDHPSWPIAQPYQSRGASWSKRVVGFTGAVWIDADGDGKFTSAHGYASRIVKDREKLDAVVRKLADFDAAVAAQAASLLHVFGIDLGSKTSRGSWVNAAENVKRGFQHYLDAWENCAASGATLPAACPDR
ncbi:MAG: CehA/McbA family metallohydrolase, partial [Pirellulales bacterium]